MTLSLPDLTDPDLYERGEPHAVWRALRRQQPVYWHQTPSDEGFWAVTGYAAGRRVLSDWRSFTSTNGTMLRPERSEPFPGGGVMLVLTDPPRHEVLRKPLSRMFNARSLAGLEQRARAIIRPLLDESLENGACEFVGDVAARIPLELTADLIGVEVGALGPIADVVDAATTNWEDPGDGDAQLAHLELLAYYADLLEQRRSAPGADMISALLAERAEGSDITDEEIILTCDNVVVAVGETVRQTASGGLLALIEHDDQWTALRRGSVDGSAAVNEILRWCPPVTHVLRTATDDVDLAGVRIRAGDAVTVWLPSINRDAEVFDRADEFLLDRSPNPHMTFGAGVHFCLGAAVARLVLRVLFQELVGHAAGFRLTGVPARHSSCVIGGPKTLPVEFDALENGA